VAHSVKKGGDNNNTEMVIVDKPPTEFLPAWPPPTEAIFNVYEIKTLLELVRYFHAAAGFPMKPTWLKAIKKGFYTSWPGLTDTIVQKKSQIRRDLERARMQDQIRTTNKEEEDEGIGTLHAHR